MSVLFTEHALDRIKTIALEPEERQELGDLLMAVDAVTGPSDLTAAFPGTVSVNKGNRGTMFMVPLGQFRAVVTTDPNHLDRMVVGTLFRPSRGSVAADAFELAAT